MPDTGGIPWSKATVEELTMLGRCTLMGRRLQASTLSSRQRFSSLNLPTLVTHGELGTKTSLDQASFNRLNTTPLVNVFSLFGGYIESLLLEGIWFVKRTFQPSLIRRKRKHGFLARAADRNGRKILVRRRAKQRTRLCA